jgi:arsenite methyltransferase
MSTMEIRTQVRDRYTIAARRVLRRTAVDFEGRSGEPRLGDDELLESGPEFGSVLYSAAELEQVPRPAVYASLGCGSPTADARLHPGQVVLDVGCGGGIDAILAAVAVLPTGRVIGVDLSAGMIELARRNAAEAGIRNACFVIGLMEELSLRSMTVDVVISNAAIHLSTDKERSLRQLFRVLAPAGRLHVIDIVADDTLSFAERQERSASTNTTAGVLSVSEYRKAMETVGFRDVVVMPAHFVADRMSASLVTATRPPHDGERQAISP